MSSEDNKSTNQMSNSNESSVINVNCDESTIESPTTINKYKPDEENIAECDRIASLEHRLRIVFRRRYQSTGTIDSISC